MTDPRWQTVREGYYERAEMRWMSMEDATIEVPARWLAEQGREVERLREGLRAWENGLAKAYHDHRDHREYQTAIATLCDLYLDPHGGLLGRVRGGPVSYDTAALGGEE